MNIIESIRIIYIYKERSARADALCKHILKFNTDIFIKEITDLSQLKYIDINSRSYLFILNELDIRSYHYFIQQANNENLDNKKCHYNFQNAVFPTLEQLYLETSKLYCRIFLEKMDMKYLNPQYSVINKKTDLDNINFLNRVIKADGLMSGKGVFVYYDHFNTNNEAIEIVKKLLEKNECVLLEDKLEGEEFSCITLSWKDVITHFPLVKDFKRVENGNKGLNTGGMGTITFIGGSMPFLNVTDLEKCKAINEKVIKETRFRGFLYGSFIKTRNNEIKLIEYNVRLGDSEAVNILDLIDSNLILHLDDPVKNPLLVNLKEHTYFRYMVPRTYCRSINQNNQNNPSMYYVVENTMPSHNFYLADSNVIFKPPITNIDNYYINRNKIEDKIEDKIENSNTDFNKNCGGLYSIGTSRTCGVLSRNNDMSLLVTENDRLVNMIHHDNLHYRTDIGLSMLEIYNNSLNMV